MPRFPVLTITLAALTIYALWGRELLLFAVAVVAITFAYHVGRADAQRERDEELQKLLEPSDAEIEAMERERGFRS